MSHIPNKQRGFTFVEIMVVIVIVASLATLLVSGIQTIRVSSRDTKRVNDINQIRNALNIYYSKYSQYPTMITPGQAFSVGSIIYLETVPNNPTPYTDNGCPDKNYDYAQTDGGISYTLTFCLGYKQDSVPAGSNKAIPEGIVPG